ncbi:MAG: hypothetical protein ACFFG0_23265, partial [Candidatus Thorarchaeota archaeon]
MRLINPAYLILFLPLGIIELFAIMILNQRYKRKINLDEFSGSGTKNDPIIINAKDTLPKHPEIIQSAKYIIFKNYEIDEINILKSQNITFDTCSINFFIIKSSSDIILKNSNVSMKIDLIRSKNIKITNSKIFELNINQSYNNLVENSRKMGRYLFEKLLKIMSN